LIVLVHDEGQQETEFLFLASDLFCEFEAYWMGFCDEIKLQRVSKCSGGLGYWLTGVL